MIKLIKYGHDVILGDQQLLTDITDF